MKIKKNDIKKLNKALKTWVNLTESNKKFEMFKRGDDIIATMPWGDEEGTIVKVYDNHYDVKLWDMEEIKSVGFTKVRKWEDKDKTLTDKPVMLKEMEFSPAINAKLKALAHKWNINISNIPEFADDPEYNMSIIEDLVNREELSVEEILILCYKAFGILPR